MHAFFSRHRTTIGLSVLLILTFALRIANILRRGPLWLDELFTYHFAQLPFKSLLLPLRYETNPPLSFLIPKLTAHGLALTDILWLRLPSLIFSLGAVYLTYYIGRMIFSRRVGLIAALMLSLSGVHIIISGEVRIYAWLTFISLIAIGLFVLLVLRERTMPRRWWIFFTFVHLLLLYSHLTALIVFIGEILILSAARPSREITRRYLFSLGVVGLGFVPWLFFSFSQKLSGIGSGAWYFATTGDLVTQLTTPFVGMTAHVLPKIIVFFIIICSLIWLLSRFKRQNRPHEIITVIVMALLPLVASSLLGVFVPKYVAFTYPFLFLMVSYFFITLTETHPRYALLPIGILMLMIPTTWRATHHVISDWHAGGKYLEARVQYQDHIVADLNSAFSLYAYTDLDEQVIPILLTEEDFDAALVKNNWHNVTVDDEELRTWVRTTVPSKHLASLFLVYTDPSITRVAKLLEEAGWKENDRYRVPGSFPVYIDTYYASDHP